MPTLDEAVEQANAPETPAAPTLVPAPAPTAPAAEKPVETKPAAAAAPLLLTKPTTEKPLEPTKEELEKGYLRQADYTRKTQEIAAEKRAWAEREERLLKMIEARLPSEQRGTGGVETVSEKIRQLREDGQHEEADKLVLEVARLETRKELDPVIRNAQAQELQSTFVNTAIQAAASDPVIQQYAKTVASRFDGNEVLDSRTGLTMADLRAAITTDKGMVVKFVPLVMRSLALEEHARALEAEMGKVVEGRVKAGLEAERLRGKRLPGQLVPASSVSRATAPSGKMSLDDALSAATEQLSATQ